MYAKFVEAKAGGTNGENGRPAVVIVDMRSENKVDGGSSVIAKAYAKDQSPASKTLCSSAITAKAEYSFVAKKSLQAAASIAWANTHIQSPASR